MIPDGDCDEDCEGRIAETRSRIVASRKTAAPPQYPATMEQGSESPIRPSERFRNMMRQRYHLPGPTGRAARLALPVATFPGRRRYAFLRFRLWFRLGLQVFSD
jgi:hypothetical protein